MVGHLASIWTASLLLGATVPLAAQSLEVPPPVQPKSYFELLKMSPEELVTVDVARMNLLFAANLPGSEKLDIEFSVKKVDDLALYVKKRTEELRPRFEANPGNFRNSEAFFKATVLVTVLQKEKAIAYDPRFAIRPGEGYDSAVQAEMVKSSKHVFINGILDDKLGTCSSMPVLWAAIGRRLGYPMKLVHAKNHLFVRWEDEKDRFNIEATEGVMVSPPDEEYKKWPFPLTDEQITKGPYLKSLTPTEELGDALNSRFWTLMKYQRYDEALGVALALRKLLPKADKYLLLADAAAPLLYPPRLDGPTRTPYEPPNPMEGVMSTIMPDGKSGPSVDPAVLQALPPHARAALGDRSNTVPGIAGSEFLPPNVRSAMQIAVPGTIPVMPDPLADLPPEARQLIQPQR